MSTTLSAVIAVLETTPPRWLRLARDLPDELLRRPAAPGQWSALECLHHITATEPVLAYRLEVFLAGGPSFPDYDPEASENRPDLSIPPAELAQEFARRRAASLEALRGLGEADLRRTTRHAGLGPVSLEQMLHHWAAHDLNHTVQAERALMQPFLDGCGPWDVFYVDHRVKD